MSDADLKIGYRPEIDGLRAFAITAVIINHFNKEIFPNGYLGVDIFFVLSGYVICSSISRRKSNKFKELESGFIWLKSMRDLGHIKAIGVGINDAQLMSIFYKNYDIDFFLVAMPYTLINQETLDEIFQNVKKEV